MLPNKGKGKAVPHNTAQGGSGHDPPRDQETVFHEMKVMIICDHTQCVTVQQ